MGRFLGQDPAEEGSNWYRYAGNDPVNFRDPTGLFQQGNPLNNLFGGYSGNRVAAQKVIPTVRYDAPFALAPNAAQIGRATLSAANPIATTLARPSLSTFAGPVLRTTNLDLIDSRTATPSLASIPLAGGPGEIQRALNNPPATSALTDVHNAYFKRNEFDDPILRYGGALLANPRVQGGLKVAQAFTEYTAAGLLGPTGLGTPVALALAAHATDVLRAGGRELATGIPTQTVGSQAVEFLANSFGFQQQARALGEAYDVLPALLAPLAANRPATKYNTASSETSASTRSGSHPTTYVPGRYSNSASEPGAYWTTSQRVFPTTRNSGLKSAELRAEQEAFFTRGLQEGKSPAELRGQAATAGYERRGGINNVGGPDRLADRGAEKVLQKAVQNTQTSGKAGR